MFLIKPGECIPSGFLPHKKMDCALLFPCYILVYLFMVATPQEAYCRPHISISIAGLVSVNLVSALVCISIKKHWFVSAFRSKVIISSISISIAGLQA
jgi:general stress protein CsbA